MLYYNGNPETVHFVNWLFHSGEVDLLALIERAQHKSLETGEGTTEEWLADSLHNRLVNILHSELGRIFTDEALTFDEFTKDQDYMGPARNKLVAPLLGLLMARIDCDSIARYILSWAAATKPLAPSLN